MAKYYIYHSSYYGTRIVTEKESGFNNEFNLEGESSTFKEAKKMAVKCAKSTVTRFEQDLSGAKENLQEIRKLKLKDIE